MNEEEKKEISITRLFELSTWLPMGPTEGPPLPVRWGIEWPWHHSNPGLFGKKEYWVTATRNGKIIDEIVCETSGLAESDAASFRKKYPGAKVEIKKIKAGEREKW